MKPQRFVIFTLVLFVLCLSSAFGFVINRYEKGYSITNFVEDCDLIVYGTVVEKEYVLRRLAPDKFDSCTTDITIDVKDLIKGTPNAGDDRVKFMIQRGECFDPKTGEEYYYEMAGEVEFELEERVLLFLRKSTHFSELRRPHGGYGVFRYTEGKFLLKRGKFLVIYTVDEDVYKGIDLPANLVIQIAKAAAKDPEASRRLEEDIKAHIKRFETLTNRLKREAKAIVGTE